MSLFIPPVFFKPATLARLTYAGAGTPDASPSDPVTFTALAIGAASADRYVVVCVAGGDDVSTNPNGPSFDGASATIGGAAMTLVVNANEDPSAPGDPTCGAAIFISDAPVVSGTTADFVLSTFVQDDCDGLNVTSYALTGISSPIPSDTVSSGATSSTALSIPENGCALGVYCCLTEAAQTWGTLVEDYDADIGESQMTSAHLNVTAAQVGPTISVTGGGIDRLALAAWGP